MSTNRTDSTELRMLIRRHVGSALEDLEHDEELVLSSGERSGRPAIQYLVTLLEDLNDYEARLPQTVQTQQSQATVHLD